MSYVHMIEEAASRFSIDPSVDLDMTGMSIVSGWSILEAESKDLGYDVLRNITEIRPLVHRLMEPLHSVPYVSHLYDVDQLIYKDKEYGGSWIRRGGVGAFFTAVRKYDRIEHQLSRSGDSLKKAIEIDSREEGILDDIGDLRRYLILWEAWWMSL